jgi:hypothetical protein
VEAERIRNPRLTGYFHLRRGRCHEGSEPRAPRSLSTVPKNRSARPGAGAKGRMASALLGDIQREGPVRSASSRNTTGEATGPACRRIEEEDTFRASGPSRPALARHRTPGSPAGRRNPVLFHSCSGSLSKLILSLPAASPVPTRAVTAGRRTRDLRFRRTTVRDDAEIGQAEQPTRCKTRRAGGFPPRGAKVVVPRRTLLPD